MPLGLTRLSAMTEAIESHRLGLLGGASFGRTADGKVQGTASEDSSAEYRGSLRISLVGQLPREGVKT